MASDGKVIICTELDNSGVEKGIKTLSGQLSGLGSTLKNIAAMLAAAFSTKKIIEFAAESSQAAMTLSDALTGLKSILEGQGRSFSDAQAFIEEYTEDGLIPDTTAIVVAALGMSAFNKVSAFINSVVSGNATGITGKLA